MHHCRRLTGLTLALALTAVWPATAQTPRTMTARDLVSMDRVSDPQVSPDGRQVAFVVSEVDLDDDRRRTDIWLVGVDGGDPLRLTSDPAADFNPRWAPDGAGLYFLSTRSGSSQVWRVTLDGETAIPITNLPLDLSNLTLSPDASHMAFSIEVFSRLPDAGLHRRAP